MRGTDVSGVECVVSLHSFFLVGTGIYKLSPSYKSRVTLWLVEVHFDSKEWAASFKKEAIKVKFLSGVFHNCVLKALLGLSLSSICTSGKRMACNVMFRLIGYQRLVSLFFARIVAKL